MLGELVSAFFRLGSQETLHSGRWVLEPDLLGSCNQLRWCHCEVWKCAFPPLSPGPRGGTPALRDSVPNAKKIQIPRVTKD